MSKSAKGFTLIELLVVVAIIAILSLIGITLFSGVQKNARDAKRKADIDAIAKSMEVNYDATTGIYPDLADTMFASGGIPKDPLDGQSQCSGWASRCEYCAKSDNNAPVSNFHCPQWGHVGNGNPSRAKFWTVCANLEDRNGGVERNGRYCRSNAQ